MDRFKSRVELPESGRFLNLTLSGVPASLLEPLAQARISVFSISTFDTDYLLVKTENLAAMARLLSVAGHQILAN